MFGMVAAVYPQLVYYWVLATFLFGVYVGLKGSAVMPPYLFVSYLAGIELLGRMSSSGLPHEFIKYAIIVILSLALLTSHKEIPARFVIFVLLLLPAIFLTRGGDFEETRQLVSGNLSGPICLAISAIYFYNRQFDKELLRKILLYLLYPLASIIGYMVVKTPDFSRIDFGFQSNFVTSIYGPNQMSSILGLGILVIGLAYILKIRLFQSQLIVLSFLGLLLFRGLLTFSRGGMITPAILLLVIVIYSSWRIGFRKGSLRILLTAVFLFLTAFLIFDYINDLTGNALSGRYTGVRDGRQVEDFGRFTSGRTIIMGMDWEIFKDNMLWGIGPGMGKYSRVEYGYSVEVAAHNEFTRILAEHGMFGVIALGILILSPVRRFFLSRKIVEHILIIAFIGFCFVFMTHAATRIAAPCFLYGLAFLRIVPSHSSNHY